MLNTRAGLQIAQLLLATSCNGPSKPAATEVCALTVFAASSLTDVAEAVRKDFVKEHSGCKVTFNFGASNALSLQIEAGAHADVFLSAAGAPVDHLLASGKVEASPKRDLFSNRLVFISNSSGSIEVKDACALKDASLERVVIGQTDAVHAGAYAKAYLSKVKCADGQTPWSALEPRLLPMPNVRAVLSVVEQQPKLGGFVYQSDALTSKAVKTQFVVQGADSPRIEYYGVRVGPSNQAKYSDAFLAEFSKPGVQNTIRAMGFVIDKS